MERLLRTTRMIEPRLGIFFESLGYTNKITFIEDPIDAVPYLSDSAVRPFIILSDINMPKVKGFELREEIHGNNENRKMCTVHFFVYFEKP